MKSSSNAFAGSRLYTRRFLHQNVSAFRVQKSETTSSIASSSYDKACHGRVRQVSGLPALICSISRGITEPAAHDISVSRAQITVLSGETVRDFATNTFPSSPSRSPSR
jgi:hypothetical protein